LVGGEDDHFELKLKLEVFSFLSGPEAGVDLIAE
jgi:hypothetical protein